MYTFKLLLIVVAAMMMSSCSEERVFATGFSLGEYQMNGEFITIDQMEVFSNEIGIDYNGYVVIHRFGPNETGFAAHIYLQKIRIVFEKLNGQSHWTINFGVKLGETVEDIDTYNAMKDDVLMRLRSIDGVEVVSVE